jgi:AraC-like DNA-binding protein
MAWSRVLHFTDPYPCQQAVNSCEVEILPTSKGNFVAGLTQVVMNNVRMQRFHVALPQISTVTIDPDRKVVGFLTEQSQLKHCGIEVAPGEIFVAAFDVLHQQSGADYHYGTMSVPTEQFPDLFREIIGRELPEQQHAPKARPEPGLMKRLLTTHKAIGQLAHDVPEILLRPEVNRALENQLVHLLVRCLAEGVVAETSKGGNHNAIIARFEDFLGANPDRPLYLAEICAAVGVAERTLRAACEEHLGIGPIRFLTLRRMHFVRRALSRADCSKTTVTRIVTDYGFWELGRFSIAYRTLFGETPSETLKRAPNDMPISLDCASSFTSPSCP